MKLEQEDRMDLYVRALAWMETTTRQAGWALDMGYSTSEM